MKIRRSQSFIIVAGSFSVGLTMIFGPDSTVNTQLAVLLPVDVDKAERRQLLGVSVALSEQDAGWGYHLIHPLFSVAIFE